MATTTTESDRGWRQVELCVDGLETEMAFAEPGLAFRANSAMWERPSPLSARRRGFVSPGAGSGFPFAPPPLVGFGAFRSLHRSGSARSKRQPVPDVRDGQRVNG